MSEIIHKHKKIVFFLSITIFCSFEFLFGSKAVKAATGANVTINNTVYLTQCGTLSGQNTKYILDNDLNSEGTCLKFAANNIEIDLNGKKITYDNAAGVGVPNADFESFDQNNLPTDWTITGTTTAQVKSTAAMPLSHSSYLDLGNSPNGTVIESGWSTLPANVTAAIYQFRGDQYWWVYNSPYPQIKFEVIFQDDTVVYTTTGAGIANGFGTFTTKNLAGQYKVRMTVVANNDYAAQYANTYPAVDLFDVRTTGFHGIDLTSNGTNIYIHGGLITQGAGQGLRCDAIAGNVSGATFEQLTFDTSGIESGAYKGSYTSNFIIKNSTVSRASTLAIFNRMQLEAAINIGITNDARITNNTMECGVKEASGWGCVYFGGSNVEVDHNTLTAHTNVTNHHAIVTYASSQVSIHDNVIRSDPGQGIIMSSTSHDFDIYNNNITLDSVAPNAEYGLIEHDAITIKDYGSGCYNAKVHGNTITLNGRYDHNYTAQFLGAANGYMDGIMQMCGSGNAFYYDNNIDAKIIDSGMWVNGIELGGITDNQVVDYRNTIKSDWSNVLFGGYAGQGNIISNVKAISNTFIKGDNPATDYHTFGQLRSGSITSNQMHFIDSKVSGGASLNDVFTGARGDYAFNYTVDWYLDVLAKDGLGSPMSDANISLTDKNGLKIFDGTTDSSGKVRIVVSDYQNKIIEWNKTIINTIFNPYTLSVTPAGGSATTKQITMDKSKTATFQFDVISVVDNADIVSGDVNSVPPPGILNGTPQGRVKWDIGTVNMQVTTTKNATCKYDTVANKPYGDMSSTFATTGGATAHATPIANVSSGQVYDFYIKCQDDYGNISVGDYHINFSINPVPNLTIPYTPSIAPGAEPNFYSKLDSAIDLATPTDGAVINSYTSGGGSFSYDSGVNGNAISFNAINPTGDAAYLTLGKDNIDFSDADDSGAVLEYWLKFNFDPHQFTGEKFMASGFPYGASTSTFMIEWYGSNPYLVFEFDKNIQTTKTGNRFMVYSDAWNLWNNWQQDEWHKVTIFWKKNSGSGNAELHMFIDGTQQGCMAAHCNDYNGTLPATNGGGLYMGIFGAYQAKFAVDELKAWNSYATLPELSTIPGGSGGGSDTTPPILSAGLPTGVIARNSVSSQLQVTTNEAATCKWSQDMGVSYDSMINLFDGLSTSHTAAIDGLQNGTAYKYYVKCKDFSGNANTTDYTIQFAVDFTIPFPTGPNLALPTNGGSASVSSTYNCWPGGLAYADCTGNQYPSSSLINGDRAGINSAHGGTWVNYAGSPLPQWAMITWPTAQNISEIDVFNFQSNVWAPVTPTVGMTTSGATQNYEVQFWNGSGWEDVSGGNVTNNNLVWNRFNFPVINTTKIRLLISAYNAGMTYAGFTEIEAYAPADLLAPIAPINLSVK